jgi:O-antigen ligase
MARGAWMGLAGLALFLLVVSWKRLTRLGNMGMVVIGFVALLGVVAVSGAVKGVERHSHTITDPTNESNLERVNRWAAGVSMFRSAPLAGVGFGAYPSTYTNYRRFSLSTEQSTERMGVHSEYLKILAETGLIGAITSLLAFFVVVRIIRRVLREAHDPYLRGLAVGMTGGLVTYGIHAAVNTYMSYDKLAVPVWMAVGVLGAIDKLNRG